MTMNDRYLTHKEKLEMFSAAEIMAALNDFFSNPNWRTEKRFVIRSEFSIGLKRADMAADWAVDSAIRYLREEFGIFYAPDEANKDDEYRKQDIKCTNDCYVSHLTGEVDRLEKEVHNECVRADYWFKAARERLTEIEKLRKEIKEQTKDNTDYILTAFRDILDTLGIDKSNYVHMDIPSLKRYTISEVAKAASNLDNYREGAIKFAADYSALQKEKEKLEKDLKHMTDWNADLEKALKDEREWLCDILEALGISKGQSIKENRDFLRRHALQRASLIKSERDKFLKTIDTAKAITDARDERMHDLITKISRMYWKTIDPGPHDAIASTAERQLDAMESYISELRTHNEALRKDINSWIAKHNNLRIRCNSVFGKDGFVTKAKITDLCDEYSIVRPGDDEDCEASLRYILDILKEYRDKAVDAEDRARGAGQAYKLICDICDKYEIKKPSSDLTLEESIDDILKRFKMTLKENQDFRYEAERLYVNMTDLQPSYRMTMMDILRAIAEDVDDREEAYCCLEAKWDTAEKLRKDWVRRYESEHERANGEHKRAERYWAQVAGLQTRIKNLEDALHWV